MPATIKWPPSADDGAGADDVTHYRVRWGASNPPVENEAVVAVDDLVLEGGLYSYELPDAAPGQYVSVAARDASGLLSASVPVEEIPSGPVPPEIVQAIPDVSGEVGDPAWTMDLRTVFNHPQGRPVTYSFIGNPVGAVIDVDGFTLRVPFDAPCSLLKRVRAVDDRGLSANAYFFLDVAPGVAEPTPAPITDLVIEVYPEAITDLTIEVY